MTEHIKNPLSGKLRGVTYEDGKIIDVHIRDTDDVVKVFVPVRPGQWIYDFNLAGSNFYRCSVCDRQETLLEKEDIYEYCPFCHCGAKMTKET